MEILHDNAAVDLLKKGKRRGLSHRYKLCIFDRKLYFKKSLYESELSIFDYSSVWSQYILFQTSAW